ncbi:flagellar hook-length control protein FliK [Acetobacterium malicum]|uniref:flagellar hook-length control protein FliK n=1 Tax=Acetobacterium malicum TaxID=52692 RepID=UPI003593D1C5
MNLEFQSAGKPTMNRLRTTTETPAAPQSKGHERSAQFKDLLDQSKQDIKQADHQLEKARENRRESKSITESNRRESEQASLKDGGVKADDSQSEEPVTEELNGDESQESSAAPTIDTAQLMGIQNFQGGIETALTRLNLKLGLEENSVPEDLAVQGQIIELKDVGDQLQGVPIIENSQQNDATAHDEMQFLQQNVGKVENQEVVEGVQEGLLKNDRPELTATKVINSDANQDQQLVDQVSAREDSDPQIVGDAKQRNGDQVEDVKSERFANLISDTDLTEARSVKQTNTLDVQASTENQIETQNPGEKGVQEINVTGINTGKGPELQPDTKVAVAQQVEQKILQNFEPNKPMVLQMTLSPDNLGDIDIKLSYDQGKLIIDITAISQETQNLLGKQINLLVRGLALQNVQVETVHLNTPVEQSSDSQDATFMMNSGSDPNENQNQTLLRERFIKNSGVLNSILTSSDEDESVMIPQNLQNYTNHRVNYLI